MQPLLFVNFLVFAVGVAQMKKPPGDMFRCMLKRVGGGNVYICIYIYSYIGSLQGFWPSRAMRRGEGTELQTLISIGSVQNLSTPSNLPTFPPSTHSSINLNLIQPP
jgi:hypothetical protein